MQENNQWLTISEKYLKKGLNVIPVIGKSPVTIGWSRYCTEQIDEAIVQKGQTGIGVCLGPASNLIALDIDTDDKEVLDNCPKSPIVRRGMKGEARFFQYSKEINCSKRYFQYGLEVLSTGSQIVLPPSIHPDTKKPYIWTNNNLLDFNLEHLPILDLSFLNNLKPNLLNKENNGPGRNNALKNIAIAILTRGESAEFAAKEVYLHDLSHHNPRWFTDKNDKWRADNEQEAQNCAFQFCLEISLGLVKKNITQVILDSSSVEVLDKKVVEYEKFKIKPFPRPEGVMGDICDLVLESAYTNVPNMALGSAISIFSVILGNRYIFQDVKANIFSLLLADSGSGKKFGVGVARSVLRDFNIIGSADYLSSQAIATNLTDYIVRLDISEEFSKLLKLIKDGGAWQSSIPQDLCRLWSASVGGFDLPSTKDSKEKKESDSKLSFIESPFISILTSTTLSEFKENIAKTAFSSGLMPRFLIFTDEVSGIQKIDIDEEKVEHLTKKIRRVFDSFVLEARASTDMVGSVVPKKYNVSKENYDYFKYLMTEFPNSAIREPNESIKFILNRKREYFKKLSLLHAVSRGETGGEITKIDMDWANEVLDVSLNNIKQFLSEASSENNTHSLKERIYGIILRNPGITKFELTKKTQFINGRQRQDILSDLTEAERISQTNSQSASKRPVTRFFAIET